MRWSWINFQVRGVLLVWIRVGQGPTALAVGAGGGCLDIFTLIYPFSFLSPSLWETTRYRLKYCLKGSLSPKATNQPISFKLHRNVAKMTLYQNSLNGFTPMNKVSTDAKNRSLGFEPKKYTEKYWNILLQNHLPQMHEIWHDKCRSRLYWLKPMLTQIEFLQHVI